jgi:hypothetical protein
MNGFIRPDLKHNRSAATDLQSMPAAIQELYALLVRASRDEVVRDEAFEAELRRLESDFVTYTTTAPAMIAETPRPNRIQRTLNRWEKSIRKRVGR